MTCNEIIYIELGVLSIKTRVKIRQFEFWKNKVIPISEEENPMKYIIEEGKRVKLKEITYYEDLCERYTSKEDIIAEFRNETKNRIRQNARDGKSKYVTYLQINPELITPSCYDNAKYQFVSMIGKLRTSSHNLHIEMGRRSGTTRERRLCHCGDGVEDEQHFLVICSTYNDIRIKYNMTQNSISDILGNRNNLSYITELIERRSSVHSSDN